MVGLFVFVHKISTRAKISFKDYIRTIITFKKSQGKFYLMDL